MRKFALAAALIFSAAPAFAGERGPITDVTVAIGPELREKADDYGARELERLAAELETDVEKALAREGRLVSGQGDRLELVLVDAVPNRPTMEQMKDTPGLSLESLSIGGATIEGRIVQPDGSSTPVTYKWYDPTLADAQGSTTWSTAQRAFDRFASKLAKGEL